MFGSVTIGLVGSEFDGDVEGHFIHYHQVSANHFRTFCECHELTVPEKDARDLTMFFEGFECGH